MFTDARLSAALETMVNGIDAPPVPLADIQRRISQPQRVQRYTLPYVRLAVAAAAVLVVALLVSSPRFVQAVEDRYTAALRALGIQPPPPAPESLVSKLTSQSATLATAQSHVPFTIVPPAGVPQDIVSAEISATPTGVYSKTTHSWRVGNSEVTFMYHRSGGRSFSLMADLFDPQSEPPAKYMFEAKDAPRGRVTLVRHERFAWRNGNQIMTAIEDEGISASEIGAIRNAMRGVAVPRAETGAPKAGTSLKLYRITKP